METGNPPSMAELVLKVSLFGNTDVVYDFYVNSEASCKEGKVAAAKLLEVDPAKHTLFRVNHMDQP
jgi:hypothetical protein